MPPCNPPSRSSSCPSMMCSFQKYGKRRMPSCSSSRSAPAAPASRSTIADFIHTRAVLAGGCSRALARISLRVEWGRVGEQADAGWRAEHLAGTAGQQHARRCSSRPAGQSRRPRRAPPPPLATWPAATLAPPSRLPGAVQLSVLKLHLERRQPDLLAVRVAHKRLLQHGPSPGHVPCARRDANGSRRVGRMANAAATGAGCGKRGRTLGGSPPPTLPTHKRATPPHTRPADPIPPDSHFSLAAMSHSTSACGQYCTALRSSASRLSRLPAAFSSCAARRQMLFLPGKTERAWA